MLNANEAVVEFEDLTKSSHGDPFREDMLVHVIDNVGLGCLATRLQEMREGELLTSWSTDDFRNHLQTHFHLKGWSAHSPKRGAVDDQSKPEVAGGRLGHPQHECL